MKKLPYREGDVVVLPLPDRGFAVGIVSRSSRWGKVIIGHFFGPRWDHVPTLNEIGKLNPEEALLVCLFGDLGLINGTWTVIGPMPDWDRDAWRVPGFYWDDGSIAGQW